MFTSYLKVALRNASRRKGYAFINISGLAIGIACCILILTYIIAELNFDRFHENSNRIYRIGIDANVGGNEIYMPVSNPPTAPAILDNYPEVEAAVRLDPTSRKPVKYENRQFFEEDIFYADPSIFKIFTFPMTQGNPETALERAYTVVITEEIAEKYFGNESPLEQTLLFNNSDEYTITGVVENVPRNSHFTFDFLLSYETKYEMNRERMQEWFNFNEYTYLLLPPDHDPAALEAKFPAMIEKHMGQQLSALGGRIDFFLQPLTDIHLQSNLQGELEGNSDIAYVYTFAAIALFILLIACINFMNLATARSANRAKEVGMRKVMGADRRRLIKQFVGESLIYSFASLLIALAIVHAALPFFGEFAGRELRLDYLKMPWLIPGFILLAAVVGLIAGSYPAFFLSAFQPVNVLKGSLKAGAGSARFRNILVVSQFIISISLIIGTFLIQEQLSYMKNKRLGFQKEQIVTIPLMDENIRNSLEAIKSSLTSHNNVLSVSATSKVPGQQQMDLNAYIPEGYTLEETQLMYRINADADFVPTLGMEISAGRNFSEDFATDPQDAVLINEMAARKFGWEDPIGKTITQPAFSEADEVEVKTVVGVVKDFHFASLHKVIEPMFITNNIYYLNRLCVKISTEDVAGTMTFLAKKWQEIDPNRPFDYAFLDQSFDTHYRAEETLNEIFSYFTVLAIFIACLGLFGMASYSAEQRTREIGIRKVLGATVPGIVYILSREMILLLVFANIIAWPLAYLGLQNWLQNFAYAIDIGFFPFILSAALVFAVGFLTIAYQAIKAALTNPIDAIRYE